MYTWLFIALLAVTLLWEIGTGKTWLWGGRIIYRKGDPFMFWGTIYMEITMIIILLFAKYVLHVRRD